MDFYDDYDFEPEAEDRELDPKVYEAKKALQEFFTAYPKDVFYERQLQVMFEKRFFHWITVYALRELVEERTIQTEVITLHGAIKIRFY